jgi:hypothetical protein
MQVLYHTNEWSEPSRQRVILLRIYLRADTGARKECRAVIDGGTSRDLAFAPQTVLIG